MPEYEILRSIIARLHKAEHVLDEMSDAVSGSDALRLKGKSQGVALALSYIGDEIRMAGHG